MRADEPDDGPMLSCRRADLVFGSFAMVMKLAILIYIGFVWFAGCTQAASFTGPDTPEPIVYDEARLMMDPNGRALRVELIRLGQELGRIRAKRFVVGVELEGE
jgi:hypothetical protein